MINEVMIQYKEYINLMKDNIDIFHINNYEFITNVNNNGAISRANAEVNVHILWVK